MFIEIASAIFAGISALSDVIGLYKKVRKQGGTLLRSEVIETMKAAEVTARRNTVAVESLNVIDDDVLEVIRENIDREKERLKESLSDPANDNAAKDKAVDIADSTICSELFRIRRLNRDRLPQGDYERIWQSHKCEGRRRSGSRSAGAIAGASVKEAEAAG